LSDTGGDGADGDPRALVFGEALWDLLPSGPVLGGAPLNFAYRLGSLGIQTRFVSQVGDDELGSRTLDRMIQLGMDTSLVSVSGSLKTATVVVRLDENREPSYVIVENVAYDAIPWTRELELAASGSDILCFGTLAQRDRRSRDTLRRIVEVFGGDMILVDVNLRPNCYTEETVKWSLDTATIAKLNDDELIEIALLFGMTARPASTAGASGDETEYGRDLVDLAEAVSRAAGLDMLVVTRGARGALAVSRGAGPVIVPGFPVTVDDPCGSGDAFAAMFMASILEGMPMEHVLARANAMGALVATQPGATGVVAPADVKTLMASGR
jgi:fructokinase